METRKIIKKIITKSSLNVYPSMHVGIVKIFGEKVIFPINGSISIDAIVDAVVEALAQREVARAATAMTKGGAK